MAFARYGQYVLLTHERHSRWLTLERLGRKTVAEVAARLMARFAPSPADLASSLTLDNGTEFALHHQLGTQLGLDTFFCDTHSPWQKGGIENAIGRLRRWLPRRADLATLSEQDLQACVSRYNNTPRKCLRYRTPAEIYSALSNRVALQP